MSSHTYSDICTNVVYIGETEVFKYSSEDLETEVLKVAIGHGWFLKEVSVDAGRKKELIVDKFAKDDFTIYALNSSEYAMVGNEWWVMFSDNKSSVEEFLKDFSAELGNESFEIEDMDSVQQTL
jgi:hypothetical protein